VAGLPDRAAVPGDPRALCERQAEDTLQRVDIRRLLAEHGGERGGGSAARHPLRAGRDHRRHQLPAAAAELPDGSEEAGRPGRGER